ncbi:MAG: hypothetical protein ABJB86_11150 [Bacteroidota bacterium]
MKLLIAALFLMLLISCTKTAGYYDNTGAAKKLSLPPYSENGKGTFGFLMNDFNDPIDSIFTIFGAFHSATMFGSSWITNTTEASFYREASTGKKIIQISGRLSILTQTAIETDFSAAFNLAIDSASPSKIIFPANIRQQYLPWHFFTPERLH